MIGEGCVGGVDASTDVDASTRGDVGLVEGSFDTGLNLQLNKK